MNKFLAKSALIIAGLAASALPALPNELLFSFSGSYGTATVSGGVLAAGTVLNVVGFTDYSPNFNVIAAGTVSGLTNTYLYLSNVGSVNGTSNVETWELYSSNTIEGQTSSQGSPLLAFTAQTSISGVQAIFTSYAGSVTSVNPTFGGNEGIYSTNKVTEPSGNVIDLTSGTTGGTITSATFTPVFTPEPASFLLFGSGFLGAVLVRRRAAAKQAN